MHVLDRFEVPELGKQGRGWREGREGKKYKRADLDVRIWSGSDDVFDCGD